MSLKLTRREVLQFVGGSALGMLFTPIPWKVLDDTAIWTQNWPWIPKGAAGELSYTGATCTLCQSACGMRARAAGKQPLSLSGIAGHPFNDGALCTMGILAHHLRYHPSRVKRTVKFAPGAGTAAPVSAQAAFDEIGAVLNNAPSAGSVVILDARPGRTASALYRQMAERVPALQYVSAGAPALDVLNTMTDGHLGPLGYDIDNARLILNFGAPLFDNWGSPSRAAKLFDNRTAHRQAIIHIESVCSRSAERAGQWIAARPGSEALVALSLANVIIDEKLFPSTTARMMPDFNEFIEYVRAFTPEAVAPAAGVKPNVLRTAARAFAAQSPAVAVIGNDAPLEARVAVMALNVLTGAIARTGGIAVRNELPEAAPVAARGARTNSIQDLPDHSIRALIVDESLSGCMVPDALLQKKLIEKNAVIISLSPFVTARPYCTQYVLPSTVVFETNTDVPGPFDTAASSLAISAALLPAPEGTMDAVQFAFALSRSTGAAVGAAGTTEDLLKQRCAAIHASKRGSVFAPSTGSSTAVKALGSADDVWTALAQGGCWVDEVSSASGTAATFTVMKAFRTAPVTVPHAQNGDALVVLPFAEMTVYDGVLVSPLLCKVGQESGLRLSLRQAFVHPSTAHAYTIVNGDAIVLTTKHGTMTVQAKVDASVMPDVLFVSTAGTRESAPSVRSAADVRLLCDVSNSGSVSPTPVTIQKVNA